MLWPTTSSILIGSIKIMARLYFDRPLLTQVYGIVVPHYIEFPVKSEHNIMRYRILCSSIKTISGERPVMRAHAIRDGAAARAPVTGGYGPIHRTTRQRARVHLPRKKTISRHKLNLYLFTITRLLLDIGPLRYCAPRTLHQS